MLARLRWQTWRRFSLSRGLRAASPASLAIVQSQLFRPLLPLPFAGCPILPSQPKWTRCIVSSSTSSKEADERIKELLEHDQTTDRYPRYQPTKFQALARSDREASGLWVTTGKPLDRAEVTGRVVNIRRSGSKLVFLDVQNDGHIGQVMLNYAHISDSPGSQIAPEQFIAHCKLIRRGDHISVFGTPPSKASPQQQFKASQLPNLIAPCLHRFPVPQAKDVLPLEDSELDRHVEMFTYPSVIDTLKLRAKIVQLMRGFLQQGDFTEVQTPILAGTAGGAVARPFETSAIEFADRKVSLRIAPELWLKRLIIGGMSKIFEIGPSFRNEGLDKTHNPEFTTCEFYATHNDLNMLIGYTECMLRSIHSRLTNEGFLPKDSESLTFKTIDFIPALNQGLGTDLPTLTLENQDAILSILQSRNIHIPSSPTLPNLIDKLSSYYLEPQCTTPTWITNIPSCLSPLSKSSIHSSAPHNQPVAARAELFINTKELINCYEEENSPFEQRRKFEHQQIYAAYPAGTPIPEDLDMLRESIDPSKIDEDYIRALEWGLPPTGGWGCGIDRLVMFFGKKERISDVLSFGNLRAVTRNAERTSKVKSGVNGTGN